MPTALQQLQLIPGARPDGQLLSDFEAKELVDSWKAEARRIGREEDRSNDILLSLFDRTGAWSQPYVDAGYSVKRYDIASGDDLVRFFPVADIFDIKKRGQRVSGVLAAPPCTSLAGSGARWWASQHDITSEEMVEKKYGTWATRYFDSPLDYAVTLVRVVELCVELARPDFHAMENPVGRIQRVAGLPKPLLSFNPCNYGDPYTKRTQLWGSFNASLPTARVYPAEGTKMHRLRGDVPEQKLARSVTPEGFAYSFFMANH